MNQTHMFVEDGRGIDEVVIQNPGDMAPQIRRFEARGLQVTVIDDKELARRLGITADDYAGRS